MKARFVKFGTCRIQNRHLRVVSIGMKLGTEKSLPNSKFVNFLISITYFSVMLRLNSFILYVSSTRALSLLLWADVDDVDVDADLCI